MLEICMLVLNAKYVCWLFVFYGPFAHLSMSYSDFILIFEIQLVDTTIDDISYTTTSPSYNKLGCRQGGGGGGRAEAPPPPPPRF